jgi:hypothetical protein
MSDAGRDQRRQKAIAAQPELDQLQQVVLPLAKYGHLKTKSKRRSIMPTGQIAPIPPSRCLRDQA